MARKPWLPKRPTFHLGKKPVTFTFTQPLVELPAGSSKEERMVATELTRRREEWTPQVSFDSGREASGGMVVDFLLSVRRIALRVQGVYWHNAMRPGVAARDDAQALRLRALGYTVSDVTDLEVNADVRGAVERALNV